MAARTTIARKLIPSAPFGARQYQATRLLRSPYKDSQDPNSLRPRSAEHTQSGRDDDVSANPDAAFNPDKTRPESETSAAGKGNETNPLAASGGNEEFNKPKTTGGDKKAGEGKRSGFGSAPKNRGS